MMGRLFDSTGRNRKFNHEFSGPDASQEDFENLCRLLVSSGNKDLLLALYARSGGLFGGNDKAGKVFSRFIEDDSGSVVDSPED